ncbi:hypothetical protein ACHAWF_015689 [Thalassiosira exigua]
MSAAASLLLLLRLPSAAAASAAAASFAHLSLVVPPAPLSRGAAFGIARASLGRRRRRPPGGPPGGIRGGTELAEAGAGAAEAGDDERRRSDLLRDLDARLDYEGRISSKEVVATTASFASDDAAEASASSSSSNPPPPPPPPPPHRCALLTILGRPNAGKSTFLNALLGEDVAVATRRPQTTRHAIRGVLTTDHVQVVASDTPGVIRKARYKLQEGMMDAVRGATRDADVFLVVSDLGRRRGGSGESSGGRGAKDAGEGAEEEEDEEDFSGVTADMLSKLRSSGRPVLICVNKVDLVADEDGHVNAPPEAVRALRRWREVLPDAFAIIPACATNGVDDPGVTALRSLLTCNDPAVDLGDAVRALGRPVPGMFRTSDPSGIPSRDEARKILPSGPPLYHPDVLTDRTDRFCASEVIRGALFRKLGKELPYCCEVRVGRFDESRRYLDEEGRGKGKRKSLIRIEATIFVERESQKGIVVGKGGRTIKDVGTDARKELQELFGVKIVLDLRVKVDAGWRDDVEKLKRYGYVS